MAKSNTDLTSLTAKQTALTTLFEDLTKRVVSNELEIDVLKRKVKDNESVVWSLNARESIFRLCRYLEKVSKDSYKLEKFIKDCAKTNRPITLNETDISDIIRCRDEFADYLSSFAHQEFRLDVMNKLPDELRDLGENDKVTYKYAGSDEVETCSFNRSLCNKLLALLDQGLGLYTTNKKD